MVNKIWAATSDKITERETKNAELARQLADECMVLLKNDGTLPVQKGKIALFGNGARNTIKGGTGSGDVNTRNNITIEEGFISAGFEVTTKSWIDRNEAERNRAKKEYLDWANSESKKQNRDVMFVIFDKPFEEPDIVPVTDEDIKASDTDTAVFVISRNSGEAADRKNTKGDYEPFENEIKNIKKLTQCYKKVIVVLNVGGIIDMNELSQLSGVNSILLMSQLGNLGGLALTDVLLGKANPSGHLSDTWAKNYMDYPSSAEFSYLNGNVDEDYYKDGIYVGYRYFDSADKAVVYPFGYGLSYTTFDISTADVSQNNETVIAKIDVKNTGKVSGKEVVQLYVSAPKNAAGLDHPYQELKGFVKTPLIEAGQTVQVKIEVPLKSLASYDEKNAAWIIGKGAYTVRIGNNSRDTKPVVNLLFESDVVTEKCKNVFPLDCDLPLISVDSKTGVAAEKTLKIDASKICCKNNEYQTLRPVLKTDKKETLTINDVKDGKCSVEDFVAQLTVKEMATLCVGFFHEAKKQSVIGGASACVPGAAGETPDIIFEKRNLRTLVLADGPAGIRLQPHFKTDKEGKVLPGGEIFGDTYTPFKDVPEGAVDYYQYCTAIPIGWALAQSWNCEAVEAIGKMIGQEMELFGVDFWLAPAQNIHRNPLCGRNFEYYSEDPLLTGKISAAITNGVQTVKGRCTTIKHFAANNQEENRYFVNAHVSERTMREIYLKGFEIAVKESQPWSLMTSYNLLNGIHTANQYDLLQTVLRDEWGFKGVVMTDWFTSVVLPSMTSKYTPKYPVSASTGCIYAGNDLQMPGSQKNIDDIIDSVENNKEIEGYKISLGDLQFCTANFIRIAAKMV